MPADKKINREKLPQPVKEDAKLKHQEEFDDKSKILDKEKGKPRRVNYIVKDLPIY